jgi:hypothetical protein
MRQTWMFAAALVLLALVAAAQDRDLSKVEMKVVKVSDNIYMLQGAGGNIGASVGEDGIVIVDDEFPPWRTKSGRPLRVLPTSRCASSSTPTGILTIPAATNPSARLRP